MVVLTMRIRIALAAAVTLAAATAGASRDHASGVTPHREAVRTFQETRVVEISAERFSFTPSEVKVPAGTKIEFRVRSDDTDHGFRIIGTDVNVRIPKRGKGAVTVTFEAAKAGRYTFECSKLCGAGHSFMRGTIVVTE
jgi:heme/copper-type cytochrome/quinol oxidase subunit 2